MFTLRLGFADLIQSFITKSLRGQHGGVCTQNMQRAAMEYIHAEEKHIFHTKFPDLQCWNSCHCWPLSNDAVQQSIVQRIVCFENHHVSSGIFMSWDLRTFVLLFFCGDMFCMVYLPLRIHFFLNHHDSTTPCPCTTVPSWSHHNYTAEHALLACCFFLLFCRSCWLIFLLSINY